MKNYDLTPIKEKIQRLLSDTPIDTDPFNPNLFDPEQITTHHHLHRLYHTLFTLDTLGLPLNLLMNLPDTHAKLLIMLSDGKLLPEITTHLTLTPQTLLEASHHIQKQLHHPDNPLHPTEINHITHLLQNFIPTEEPLETQ